MDRDLIKLYSSACHIYLVFEIAPNNPFIIMHFMFPSRLILQHSPFDDDNDDDD